MFGSLINDRTTRVSRDLHHVTLGSHLIQTVLPHDPASVPGCTIAVQRLVQIFYITSCCQSTRMWRTRFAHFNYLQMSEPNVLAVFLLCVIFEGITYGVFEQGLNHNTDSQNLVPCQMLLAYYSAELRMCFSVARKIGLCLYQVLFYLSWRPSFFQQG